MGNFCLCYDFGKAVNIRAFFANKSLLLKVITLLAAGFVFLAAILLLWISSWRIPTLDSFQNRSVTQSTKIYDRTGQVLLYDVHQNIRRTVVPFDQISPNVKSAVLAIEDVGFYKHGGIRITSIIRAILVNITGLGYNQGGSTITQQVVKNSLLTSEKSISRKIKEWVLAPKVEKILSKDEIFSIYLNEIPFGGSIYGVEEAAQAFFGKKASDVDLAESAYLAALPNAPTYYSPYGQNKAALDDRKNLVLREMLQNNFIDQKQYDQAKAEKVTFRQQTDTGIKAPHFVMYVKDQLAQKYGEQALDEGGLKVITTLDYDLEKKAEDLANTYALQNKKNFNAENLGLVAVAPKTGDILAMVGSRNYFDKQIEGNFNITTAHRQPGSAFKPFAYAEAFLKGFTPETVVFNVPTEFNVNCPADPSDPATKTNPNCYVPGNYDGKYNGPMTMREALAQSMNIPSIKTLYLAGMKDTLRLAKDMGIQSLTNVNQYGLTLVLGGGEVSLLDLTSAYSVFANGGERNQNRAILEVRDKDGNVLEKADENPQPTRILDETVADKISDILSDNVARTPEFGAASPLYFPGRDVAVKTGTTNDFKDALIVGYTPDIAIGAWAGNNNNTPMEKKIAAFIIAPYWNKIMGYALTKVPDAKFVRPPSEITDMTLKPVLRGKWQGGVSTLTDRVSGDLATQYTPPESTDEILSGGVHSILYWVNKDDPRGPIPAVKNDSQFESWEFGVRAWAQANGYGNINDQRLPTQFDTVHISGNSASIEITNPRGGQTYNANSQLSVSFNNRGQYDITKVDYFVNETYIGSAVRPFRFSFTPANVSSIHTGGTNTLKIVAYDEVFNHTEQTVQFSVSGS